MLVFRPDMDPTQNIRTRNSVYFRMLWTAVANWRSSWPACSPSWRPCTTRSRRWPNSRLDFIIFEEKSQKKTYCFINMAPPIVHSKNLISILESISRDIISVNHQHNYVRRSVTHRQRSWRFRWTRSCRRRNPSTPSGGTSTRSVSLFFFDRLRY